MEHVVIFNEDTAHYYAHKRRSEDARWTDTLDNALILSGEDGIDEAATIASELASQGHHVSIVTL